MPGGADYLVELRGFEPLTSAIRAHACWRRPPLPRPHTAEGAPVDPALEVSFSIEPLLPPRS
jgi:hypothetical protein